MSVYLIAGGAGFIGANFVSYLRTHNPDDKVIVVDYLGFASNEDNLTRFGDSMGIITSRGRELLARLTPAQRASRVGREFRGLVEDTTGMREIPA